MGKTIFDTIDPKMMARIQALRLMDDDFMTVVFGEDKNLTEFLLKILLSRDDLRVKRVSRSAQPTLASLLRKLVTYNQLYATASFRFAKTR